MADIVTNHKPGGRLSHPRNVEAGIALHGTEVQIAARRQGQIADALRGGKRRGLALQRAH